VRSVYVHIGFHRKILTRIQRLIILGQYEISVQKGQITILGSVLHASKSVYRVYAAASHALPVIRCPASDVEDTMIRIKSFESGLESLSGLSPLFGKLWNEAGPLGQNSDPSSPLKQNSTFQIVSFFPVHTCIAKPNSSFPLKMDRKSLTCNP